MFIQRKKCFLRLLAVFMLITMLLSINVTATSVSSRASYYLDSYNAYIYPAGLGKIQVYFSVTGVNYMDDIGALTIRIYESTDNETWTWVETFTNGDTPSILGHDTIYYSGHVDYKGTIGHYYKAYVTLWAGKDGDGDTRYMWTLPKKATLFAG